MLTFKGGPLTAHVQADFCKLSAKQPSCCSVGNPRGNAHCPFIGVGTSVGAEICDASKRVVVTTLLLLHKLVGIGIGGEMSQEHLL